MKTIDRIQFINSLIKGALFININEHRDYYDEIDDADNDITPEIMDEMKKRNLKIEVQVFLTPGSQINIFHYDLDTALDIAIGEIGEIHKQMIADEKRKDDPSDPFYLWNQMQKNGTTLEEEFAKL